ncbi:MSMEG_0565 family glycosyltransferase [Aquincola sp. MAHUQ-54]|uniref:MSMEG_0565 family glycosyltransferase n=1 Tax=Aquincola agrisoli TaxID=3119538 RepID=A0AAW9QAM0_9BURK
MAEHAARRIALLTHSVNPRGGVVHVLELGRALQAAGHEVTLIAPAARGQRFFRETPCRVSLAPLVPQADGTALADGVRARIDAVRSHLRALLRHQHFDVLHAHDGIGANALADLQAEGLIDGYVRTVHHVDRFADAQVQAWEERSLREARLLLCVSALWRRRLREQHGLAAHEVRNGVDPVRFSAAPQPADAAVAHELGLWLADAEAAPRPAAGGRPASPLVLTVGGIEQRKNTRRTLQAFARLRRQLPRAQLVVAGGASVLDHAGEVAAFHAEAAAAGLAIGPGRPVVLLGPVPDAGMPALYRSADVLAMPSLLEGFGLAALEALACGTRAVVSRIAPFTEHFGDGDVHWADPLDADSIADALRAAVALGRRAPPAVCSRFGWAESAQHHLALYGSPVRDTAPAREAA